MRNNERINSLSKEEVSEINEFLKDYNKDIDWLNNLLNSKISSQSKETRVGITDENMLIIKKIRNSLKTKKIALSIPVLINQILKETFNEKNN